MSTWQEKCRTIGQGMTACGCLIFWAPVAIIGVLIAYALIASLFTGGGNKQPTSPPARPAVSKSVTNPPVHVARTSPFIDPNELEIGATYQVSRETPLMPSPNPDDPLAALDDALKMYPGGYFTVISSQDVNGNLWYNVVVSDGTQDWTMWINAAALYGQDLKKAPEQKPQAQPQPAYTPKTSQRSEAAPAIEAPYQAGMVYITDYGKKYHRNNCRMLKSIAGKMTPPEARAQGYKPCKVCKP